MGMRTLIQEYGIGTITHIHTYIHTYMRTYIHAYIQFIIIAYTNVYPQLVHGLILVNCIRIHVYVCTVMHDSGMGG